MRSLSEFATYQEVFKNATVLPAFFDTNLADPGRVVKAFLNDPQAHIRIFYYQYLRLCYELQTPKSQIYVQKFEELINNPTFQLIFYQDDDPSIYNDTNAKGLISQFFQLLGSGEHTVQEAINNNPIMDVILVHFIRTLLILTNQTEKLDNYFPKEQLIDYLCTFFGVEVQFHGECCHYVESDIFVYEENQAAVYMAYISPYDIQSNNEPQQLLLQEDISLPQPQRPILAQDKYQPPPPTPVPSQIQASRLPVQLPAQAKQTGKESYIASEFLDYTHGTQQLQSKAKELKGSGTNLNGFNNARSDPKPTNYNDYASSNVQSLTNPQSNKLLAMIETTSINSVPENKNVQYTRQVNNAQPEYFAKPSSIIRGQITHLQFQEVPSSNSITSPQSKPLIPAPVYQPFATSNIPTKDYTAPPTSTSQNNQYNAQNQYFSSKNESSLPQKPVPSTPADPKKDLFYNPKLQNPAYYNSNVSTQKLDYKSVLSQGVSPKNGAALNATSVPTAGGKKKGFGLNVSQQFTNSFTMKSMSQPYKSNVQKMKNRARNFRASISSYLK